MIDIMNVVTSSVLGITVVLSHWYVFERLTRPRNADEQIQDMLYGRLWLIKNRRKQRR